MIDTSTRKRLQDEREFLLRSIEDLQDQRRTGEIDPERFEQLLGDYTSRAATTLRTLNQLEAPTVTDDERPERPRGHWVAPAVAAGLVVGAIAIILPGAVSDRAPGQTITGNTDLAAPDPTAEQVVAFAASRPDNAEAQLGAARALLGQGQLIDALKAYDRAAALEPGRPEPHAYGGWIVLLAGLPDRALARLDRAVDADPSYPDAHFFRAMALRELDRDAEAVTELETYLRLTPSADPLRAQVEAVLDELTSGADAG